MACNSEAVAFAEFAASHPEYRYLGLNVADTNERAQEFVRRYGWTWPSIVDPARERAKRLGAEYQPVTILLDAEGRIVGLHDGEGSAEAWSALAERL